MSGLAQRPQVLEVRRPVGSGIANPPILRQQPIRASLGAAPNPKAHGRRLTAGWSCEIVLRYAEDLE